VRALGQGDDVTVGRGAEDVGRYVSYGGVVERLECRLAGAIAQQVGDGPV
jgi:hypothetical protein